MSSDAATSQLFFDRALREAQRYGEDPWVFLRELVQNSRDAGADRIAFTTRVEGPWEIIACEDNGEGMDRAHLERYLLRLYASSKEEDPASIGFFGVGFWSVLLFDPTVVRVISRHGGETNAFEINCKQRNLKPLDTERRQRGTQIILYRYRKQPDEPALRQQVRERLVHYAGPIRPKSRSGLILACNGVPLNRELQLPPYLGKNIKHKRFDGVLGFGTDPSVKLYKEGILVRDLATLDEIIPSRKSKLPQAEFGFHPVIALNVNGIELLMDRHTVYENPLLYEVVAYCEEELLRLHGQLVKRMFPLNFRNRIFHFRSRLPVWLPRAPYLLLVLLGFLASYWLGVRQGNEARQELIGSLGIEGGMSWPIDSIMQDWQGSVVESPGNNVRDWQFEYESDASLLFRIRSLTRYDSQKGLIPEESVIKDAYPTYHADDRTAIRVHAGVFGLKPFPLPLPSGYELAHGSLVLKTREGADLELPVYADQFGHPVVHPAKPGTLTYRISPNPGRESGPVSFAAPGLHWPAPYRRVLTELQGKPVSKAMASLFEFLSKRLVYTRVPERAASRAGNRSWLARTLETEAGDCDVLNGLLVLMARELGVDARLSVGLVGRKGKAEPVLHAWVRYYDQDWKTLDLTREGLRRETLTQAETDPATAGSGPGPSSGDELAAEGARTPPVAQTVPPSRTDLPWIWLLLLPLAGALFLFWRRGNNAPASHPEYAMDLFRHYFHYGSTRDPWKLRFRPLFPLVSGGMLSLYEVQKYADRGRLCGAFPGSRLLARVKRGVSVLDRSGKMAGFLTQYLPSMIWLEDMETMLHPKPLHPALQPLEDKIRELDSSFRLFQVPGDSSFREVNLPMRGPGLGKNRVLLGEDHPLYARLLQMMEGGREMGLFQAVKTVLEKTTFYLNEKDRFLTRFAEELWRS